VRISCPDSFRCVRKRTLGGREPAWVRGGQRIRCVDYLHKKCVDSHSMGKPSDLVQGTLDLLILKTISLEPQHGWAIAKRIQQISNEVLQVQQGSLYPALHRLEQQGWIRAKWAESDSGRQAKFYSLTAAGRAQLEREKESWSRLSTAINLVVEGA
jgi:PadR family transcriptional regulator, regulatory protein PadR